MEDIDLTHAIPTDEEAEILRLQERRDALLALIAEQGEELAELRLKHAAQHALPVWGNAQSAGMADQ